MCIGTGINPLKSPIPPKSLKPRLGVPLLDFLERQWGFLLGSLFIDEIGHSPTTNRLSSISMGGLP